MQIQINDLSGLALSWVYKEIYFAKLIQQGQHIKQWLLERHKNGEVTDESESPFVFSDLISHEKIGLEPAGEPLVDSWIARKGRIFVYGDNAFEAVMRCFIMNHYGLTKSDQCVFVHDLVK